LIHIVFFRPANHLGRDLPKGAVFLIASDLFPDGVTAGCRVARFRNSPPLTSPVVKGIGLNDTITGVKIAMGRKSPLLC
jgi:hypothetical protein